MYDFQTKIGILGGGQLGKMLALAAGNWHLPVYAMDESNEFPAAPYCHEFVEGDFKNFGDVYNFGQKVDVITIEIEHVNTEALKKLVTEGKKVHPNPWALEVIKDKGTQKKFYEKHHLPTSGFQLFENENEVKKAISDKKLTFPFVQKSRLAGYDGKGVAIIKNEDDLNTKLLTSACLTEDLVDIEKELAVIVSRNEKGEIAAFPAVEMEFNAEANLVEFLLCPAAISAETEAKAKDLAKETIEAFGICGLLAVEMFLTKDGKLLVNEVAPRPHNSGHHTIDSCYTSQYEQHLRALLNLPPGDTSMKTASAMVNLLGEPDFTGPVIYKGVIACLHLKGIKMHLYGKELTKPFRKMGHVTIVDDNIEKAREKAIFVKNTLKVIA